MHKKVIHLFLLNIEIRIAVGNARVKETVSHRLKNSPALGTLVIIATRVAQGPNNVAIPAQMPVPSKM